MFAGQTLMRSAGLDAGTKVIVLLCPFLTLQSWHAAILLSGIRDPAAMRGTMWSSVIVCGQMRQPQ